MGMHMGMYMGMYVWVCIDLLIYGKCMGQNAFNYFKISSFLNSGDI